MPQAPTTAPRPTAEDWLSSLAALATRLAEAGHKPEARPARS